MSRRIMFPRDLTCRPLLWAKVSWARGPGKSPVCAMHRWSTPRRAQLHSTALPDSAYRSLVAGPGPGCCSISLVGLLRNREFAGNARRYAICQSVVSWKKDTPKVSTKWLGCVWKSSRTDWELRCWIAMWLAEGGYTTSVHLLLSTSGSVRRVRSQLHVDHGEYVYSAPPCSLGASHAGRKSQRVVGGAPGSRSAQRLRQL